MTPPPSVLILTTTEGHFSLAQACEDILKTAWVPSSIVLFEESLLRFYSFVYRYKPHWYRPFFRFVNSPFISWLATPLILAHNYARVRKAIEEHQPTVVINTSFSFSPALSVLKKKYGFRFINVVPNTYTFFWHDIAMAADVNFVFDERAKNVMQLVKPTAQLGVSGWFVRKKFYELPDLEKLRIQLGLRNVPTFLITSGSEGTQHVKDLVIQFTKQNTYPVQLVVTCGNNTALEKRLTAFADQHQQLAPNSPTHIKVIGFTPKLHEYMHVADLVVGKAGPNTVFEAVATITPFLVTTHVGGLEDGVLEVISSYGLGEIAEETPRALKRMRVLLEQPDLIEKYKKACQKLAAINSQASKHLLESIQLT
jgi:UDP-N-acetylglucosamine:LPS N-acetylglucosamine transferase